jgi:hypothetical protein
VLSDAFLPVLVRRMWAEADYNDYVSESIRTW